MAPSSLDLEAVNCHECSSALDADREPQGGKNSEASEYLLYPETAQLVPVGIPGTGVLSHVVVDSVFQLPASAFSPVADYSVATMEGMSPSEPMLDHF